MAVPRWPGGIIFYGYIDDILAEGNTAIRCDNEGIRNTGFHPDGWTKSGYPAIIKVRYNISIDDGSPHEGSAAYSHLFYYAVGGSSNGADYPIIHNNIFKLGANTTRIFGTGSTGSIWSHFYNNILYGKDTVSVFDIGSKSVMTHGSFDYNIIYPKTLIDRSKFASGVYGNTGISKAIVRSEFDVSKLAGFKLNSADQNISVGAGFRADQTLEGRRDLSKIFSLTRDFFGNAIRPDDVLDIGVHQIGNEGLKAVEFKTGLGGSYIQHQAVPVGGLASKPSTDPTRNGYKFDGWYTDESYTTAWNFETCIVSDNTVLYAKWISSTDETSYENDLN
ncbi:hypothetical protein GCM10008933_26080 [Paenibacillus motobuensis]|uniref:Bacterial repeat domain-containing protein n=2 Tax=Paenibacillus motobuensis TaxID=295324 RepID=A0ABN0YFQ9_9BACL